MQKLKGTKKKKKKSQKEPKLVTLKPDTQIAKNIGLFKDPCL